MTTPKGWNDEEWDDYEEYFESLTCQEQEIELQLLQSLGKAKIMGKIIVPNNSNYEM
jgi:hypothetical protein